MQQIDDWRYAISYLESRSEIDPTKIGLWGTSYAGGHAMVLGATDIRLRAVVAQVPTISGYEQGLRRVAPDLTRALQQRFADDDRLRARGEPGKRQVIASSKPADAAPYRSPDAVSFYNQPIPAGVWRNETTVESLRRARMYEPGLWVSRVSPTALLMIVALNDTVTVTDLALAAYERALQPKRLLTIEGGHFDPYLDSSGRSSSAAVEWFSKYLT